MYLPNIVKPGEQCDSGIFMHEVWIGVDKADKAYVELDIRCRHHYDTSRMVLGDMVIVDGTHYIAKIYGGRNGKGDWVTYLTDIRALVMSLTGSYILDIENDACDDVFVLEIAMPVGVLSSEQENEQ